MSHRKRQIVLGTVSGSCEKCGNQAAKRCKITGRFLKRAQVECSHGSENPENLQQGVSELLGEINSPSTSSGLSIPTTSSAPRPRPKKIRQFPRLILIRNYTTYGRTNISGATILLTLDAEWFNDDLIESSLTDLVAGNPTISEDVAYCNTRVFSHLANGGMMDWWDSMEEATGILESNAKRAVEAAGRKFNALSKKLVLMPMFHDDHWMLAAILNPMEWMTEGDQKTVIYFLDPMGNLIRERNGRVRMLMQAFFTAHIESLKKKFPEKYEVLRADFSKFVMAQPKNVPLQTNLYDCGPTIVNYMEAILDPSNGFLKQKNPMSIDWNTISTRSSVETVRHRVRARILNSARGPSRRTLEDIVERGVRAKKDCGRSRRSRSEERQNNSKRNEKRRYSVDPIRIVNVERKKQYIEPTLFENPARACAHPATIAVRKLQVAPEYQEFRQYILHH